MSNDWRQALALWGVLVLGAMLFLLTHVWVPSTLIVGPLHLGDAAGECHGIDERATDTWYLAICGR